MDLALALGMPVADLESRISLAEFDLWSRWSRERGFPMRRIEMHLAQIAHLLAIGFGFGKPEQAWPDYLLDPPPPIDWCPWPRPPDWPDSGGSDEGDADDDDIDDGDPFAWVPITV